MLQNMFYIPGKYWSRGFNSLELQHSPWNITSYNFWLYNLLPFVFIKLIQFGLNQK